MEQDVNLDSDPLQSRVQEILADVMRRTAAGEVIAEEALLAENLDLSEHLRQGLARLRLIQAAAEKASNLGAAKTITFSPEPTPRGGGLIIRCPHCREQFETRFDTPVTEIVCDSCGNSFHLAGTNAEARDAAALASLGHFDLIERIGVGGFGTVWKGRDGKLDRTVAIKVPRQGSMGETEVEKFLREARAAAQLNHPHIVSVHEVGRDGSRVFIVSDYVQGASLEKWLSRQRPTIRQAVSLCVFVAEALHHAHEQGVVHRDLKPGNIMIGMDGQPRVMDFGLARREAGEVTMTLDGQLLGTPAYMPPEQALGKGHDADRRSDVYSLGVILFELLTGEKPFRGDYVQLMHQVIHDAPPSPRTLNGRIPRDLETITLKCLDKDPSRRYQTAKELADELRRQLRGKPIFARPIGRVERGWRWAKREPALAALWVGVVILSLVSTIAAAGFFAGREALRAALERETLLRSGAQTAAERAVNLQNEAQAAAASERSARRLLETQKEQLVEATRHAEQSRAEATSALYYSLTQQARATRMAGESGYREEVLRLVREASRLKTSAVDKVELRDVAVAALGDVAGTTPHVVEGYKSPITSVAVNHDRQQVLTGHNDGAVVLGNMQGNGASVTIHNHLAPVIALLSDESSGTVISATGDGHILRSRLQPQGEWTLFAESRVSEKLYSLSKSTSDQIYATVRGLNGPLQFVDIDSAQPIATLNEKAKNAHAVLSPDLKTCAQWNGMSFELARTQDVGDDEPTWEKSPFAFVHDIAFSSDSTMAAIGCEEGILVRSVTEKTNVIYRRDIPVRKAFFLRGNRLIGYLTLGRDIVVWDYVANREITRLRQRGRFGALPAVAASAENESLASASGTKVQILDVTHTAEKRSAPAHDAQVTGLAIYPNGEAMATLAADGSVRLWRLPTLELLAESRVKVYSRAMAIHPAGQILITGGWPMILSDPTTLQKLGEVKHPVGNTWQLAFSPDGNYFGACGDRGVCVWLCKNLFDEHGTVNSTAAKPLEKLVTKGISSVCFDRSSQWVAWAIPETGDLRVKRIGTTAFFDCPTQFGPNLRRAFPFGKDAEFLFVDSEGFINVWCAEEEGSLERRGHVGVGARWPIAISQDATRMVVGSDTRPISVWNPQDSRRLYDLPADGAAIYCIEWSADGKRLYFGLSDGSVSIWNTDEVENTLQGLSIDESPSSTDRLLPAAKPR